MLCSRPFLSHTENEIIRSNNSPIATPKKRNLHGDTAYTRTQTHTRHTYTADIHPARYFCKCHHRVVDLNAHQVQICILVTYLQRYFCTCFCYIPQVDVRPETLRDGTRSEKLVRHRTELARSGPNTRFL